MSFSELARLAGGAIFFHRLRSFLTMLGILIGIASVILLTSIGEGTKKYVLDQFGQFGTNLIFIRPGRIQTSGIPGALGATIHKLTIEDAEALHREGSVDEVIPVSFGMARVEANEKGRDVYIIGATSEGSDLWGLPVRQGSFLPPGDPRRAPPVATLGSRLKHELFGDGNALGERVRIGGRRFLVVGIMESKGDLLGIDLDDRAYIPVSQAMSLFNRDGLEEIHVRFPVTAEADRIASALGRILRERHRGEEDFTIITQTGMLDVFTKVLNVVSLAVVGIGGISLVVGAIGILTMMWIAVNERIAEIGLAMSLGATRAQVQALFLAEAAILSSAGGAAGVATGVLFARAIQAFIPALPVRMPLGYALAAVLVSLGVGLAAGALPARRASLLDPIEALRAE